MHPSLNNLGGAAKKLCCSKGHDARPATMMQDFALAWVHRDLQHSKLIVLEQHPMVLWRCDHGTEVWRPVV